MYHCLTLLLQGPCPLTFNLILKFPNKPGSHPLSLHPFHWRAMLVVVTGGCQVPLVNINLFSSCFLFLFLSNLQCIWLFFFSFVPPATNITSSISLNMQRGAFADLPSAPHTFLRSEKLVQKSNLTKGCLESIAEASLCRGLMVRWGRPWTFLLFWMYNCSCWTAGSEGWQERWDESMLSCELNCGPSSKTWSTWQMYGICEGIHDWPVGLIEICSRGNLLCWQAAATGSLKVRQLMVKWLFQVNLMVSLSLKKTINPSLFTHVFRNRQVSTEAPLWQLWASYDPLCKYKDPKVELCPAPQKNSLIKGLLHQTEDINN